MGLSALASVLLHAFILWPLGILLKPPAPPERVVLEAVLLAPALTTEPEKPPVDVAAELPPEPAPAVLNPPEAKPAAVPPAPTSVPAPTPLPLPPAAATAVQAAKPPTAAVLTKQKLYPPEAVERGLEGDVVVMLNLSPTGAVIEASIASGSGHALLDAAALEAVKRIGGLPAGQRQLLLPVQFRLD